jgi:hypothetical protein
MASPKWQCLSGPCGCRRAHNACDLVSQDSLAAPGSLRSCQATGTNCGRAGSISGTPVNRWAASRRNVRYVAATSDAQSAGSNDRPAQPRTSAWAYSGTTVQDPCAVSRAWPSLATKTPGRSHHVRVRSTQQHRRRGQRGGLDVVQPPRSSYRPLRCGLQVDRRGQTAAAKGTVRTVHLAKEDHDVVWVRSCRL